IGTDWENEMRRSEWVGAFGQDLRYGVRQLLRSPVVTLVAVVTLALGIGANTAIYSVVNSVLLRPLPYKDPERIMLLRTRWPKGQLGTVSGGNFNDYRTESRSFEVMSAIVGASFNVIDIAPGGAATGAEPERIFGARATWDFFKSGEMAPLLGRYFLPSEDTPGANKVAVLSYPFWEQHFGADRNVLGREVLLNGERHTIVGVAQKAYTLSTNDEQLWVPLALTPEKLALHDEYSYQIVGKLKPGVTREQAQQELARIHKGILARFPQNIPVGQTADVTPLHDVLVQSYRTQLLVLLGAVGFVLLIACGNVANLLLARATARQKEIAVRAALGAGRWRIVRQLLTESVVLSLVGGAAGLFVASLGIRFLVSMSPPGVPRLDQAGLSPDVLGFTLLLTLLSGIAFGLVPALRAGRTDLQGTLREGGKGASSGAGGARDRLRGALVVTEIAGALVLLVSAGLLIRSSLLLSAVRPGFEPSNVLSARVALPRADYSDPARVVRTFERIAQETANIPGAQAAAVVSSLPLQGGWSNGLVAEGKAQDDPANFIDSNMRIATPDYFKVMGIRLVRGRTFTAQDDASAPKVMVINETLARTAFPGQDPIGKRLSCCEKGPDGGPSFKTVVGVVSDLRAWGLGAEIHPEFYMSIQQAPADAWDWGQRAMSVVVRATSNPAALAPGVRQVMRGVDPTVPVYNIRTLDEIVSLSTASSRFNTLLLTMLGATGLILAAVGIYGVIAYFVTQRTHEIGLRMALGASATKVLGMVVRQGMLLAAAGIAVGSVAAYGATRALASLLYGVTPTDPITFIGVGALLAFVALLACLVPARRATRVDPMVALRTS
ncbi:MAG TPA: ABC transporter permease, partial [Gemmatimonadaceae bacterium]|nr:ABC transporter permease [Gemmatimonadaceae bacterium]